MSRRRDENGQILVLMVVGLFIVLLGITGLVIDVGKAYVVKRQLQASADAAAIAGADALPSVTAAINTAASYGVAGNNKVSGATQSANAYCLQNVTYCYGSSPGPVAPGGQGNGLVVKESASVPTTFLKVLGVSSFNVTAQATACGLCGALPLNIVIVADRTGSMDQSHSMPYLRSGIETFLETLNPALDDVSLLVLPPGSGTDCTKIGTGAFPFNGSSYPTSNDDDYALVHYSNDYLTGDQLNQSSQLVNEVENMCSVGGTAYKDALIAAKQELDNVPSDRKSYTGVIVFETDGAANTAPDSYFDHSTGRSVSVPGSGNQVMYLPAAGHEDDVNRPCGSALDYVNGTVKPAGIVVMTVGYSVVKDDGCYQAPHLVETTTTTTATHHHKTTTTTSTTYSGVGYKDQAEDTTAEATLQNMASPGDYYTASDAASMNQAFATIGGKLAGAKLVPDSDAP